MFFFFISLIFINLFIYYGSYVYLIFLFITIYSFGKKVDIKTFIISIGCLLMFFTLNINYYNFYTEEVYFDSEVKVIEKYEKYSVVHSDGDKYLIYNNDYNFNEGSLLYLRGSLENIKGGYEEFNLYLNKKGVNYKINYSELYILENNVKVNEEIVNKLLENKSEVSKSYLKLILFNDKDENVEEFYNAFSVYSLTYLIAVSGFHIRLLFSFFKRIFKKEFVGYIFVCFYLYLLKFSVSSYRAFLYYVFKKINKRLNFNLSSNDILSLIGSVFILVNPSIMFSYSFIFSFLSTFVLEIINIYPRKKGKITIYIYLINIPLMLLNYYKLNISTIIFSIVLSYPISFIYIFSFVYVFLDKFYLIYELCLSLFMKLFSVLNGLNFIVVFGKPSIVFVIIYYVFLLMYFIFKERKRRICFIYILSIFLLLGYQYCKPLMNNNEQLYFLNVGQGDCTVFFIPNSKEVVIVDTGGNKYSDIATNKIIPFLESKGINKIRKIIITHDDFDHNGALNSLKDNFDVGEIIETSLVKEVMVGNKEFKNLNVSNNRDNDGSIVLYGDYGGYKILLMGDASKDIEEKIVEDINGVDILKVGHHGSNTSSSDIFLDKINGKIAIISVGKNNSYGHPHDEILDSLDKYNYIILRTDENNNIGFGKNLFNLSFIDYFK